jgi:hypothetical protein
VNDKFFAVPYVGVSDVGGVENITELQKSFSPTEHLRLKAGITMTRKALWGIPTKWKEVCPPKEDIHKIFYGTFSTVLHVVHYADYDGVDLAPSLEVIAMLGGPHLHAIQLDMIWPDPRVLEACKKAHPKIQFIVQVGTKALDLVGDSPLRMWEAVKNYDGLADYFLLDRSMGRGKALDARSLVRFVDILYERMTKPGVVVAGGLGPTTLDLVEPLMAMYPRLSIDAQGQLRESGRTLDGPISMPRTTEYVDRAITMHRKYNVMF